MFCITAWDARLCHVRNCQFVVAGNGALGGPSVSSWIAPDSELIVENCLIVGPGLNLKLRHAKPVKAVLRRSTLLGSSHPFVSFYPGNKIDPPLGEKAARPFQMEISANVVDGPVYFNQYQEYLAKEKALSAAEVEQLLTHLIAWRESRNLYLLPEDCDLLRMSLATPTGKSNPLPRTVPIKTLADWKSFWRMAELDSERGQAKFHGGDGLVARARQTPEQLVPEDFRLCPDSPGYRAGKDGKDLGADVDLVGPGPAYERWKKTPEYHQWLKDIGLSATRNP
jgi:hypothetical protein